MGYGVKEEIVNRHLAPQVNGPVWAAQEKTPKQNDPMERVGMTICQPCLCRSGVYTPALFSSVYETNLNKAEKRLAHVTGGSISER